MLGDNTLPVREKSRDHAQEGMCSILLSRNFEDQFCYQNLSPIVRLQFCKQKWLLLVMVKCLTTNNFSRHQVRIVKKFTRNKLTWMWIMTDWNNDETAANMNRLLCWVHHMNIAGTCLLLPGYCVMLSPQSGLWKGCNTTLLDIMQAISSVINKRFKCYESAKHWVGRQHSSWLQFGRI